MTTEKDISSKMTSMYEKKAHPEYCSSNKKPVNSDERTKRVQKELQYTQDAIKASYNHKKIRINLSWCQNAPTNWQSSVNSCKFTSNGSNANFYIFFLFSFDFCFIYLRLSIENFGIYISAKSNSNAFGQLPWRKQEHSSNSHSRMNIILSVHNNRCDWWPFDIVSFVVLPDWSLIMWTHSCIEIDFRSFFIWTCGQYYSANNVDNSTYSVERHANAFFHRRALCIFLVATLIVYGVRILDLTHIEFNSIIWVNLMPLFWLHSNSEPLRHGHLSWNVFFWHMDWKSQKKRWQIILKIYYYSPQVCLSCHNDHKKDTGWSWCIEKF